MSHLSNPFPLVAGLFGLSRAASSCACKYTRCGCFLLLLLGEWFERTVRLVSVSSKKRRLGLNESNAMGDDTVLRRSVIFHRSWAMPLVGAADDVSISRNWASPGRSSLSNIRTTICAHPHSIQPRTILASDCTAAAQGSRAL